jgi:hypothetical protein
MADDPKVAPKVEPVKTVPNATKQAGSAPSPTQVEQHARAEASRAAQEAIPTGKDIPAMAAKNVQGHQTAHNPDQPKPGQKNSAAQTEPALIGRDGGSIPHGMIPSPTGLVPASVVGAPAEALENRTKILKAEKENTDLDEELLRTMSKPEIRAVAHDRGYRISQGGKNSIVRSFLQEQARAKQEAEAEAR